MDIDINGLIYLLGQAGTALAQANARIAEKDQTIAALTQQLESAETSKAQSRGRDGVLRGQPRAEPL